MKIERKIFAVLCVLAVFGTIVSAQDMNITGTPTVTVNATPIVPKEEKFRVGPTVILRPLNDDINKSSDGLIELYIDNPSLNDVALNADIRITVPSGIYIYSQGFALSGAAGAVYGTLSVPPGSARSFYTNIKAEKTGRFNVHLAALYWPGDKKDEFQQISLDHPFQVNEPSPSPRSSEPTNGVNGGGIPKSEGVTYWWLIMIVIIAIVAIVALGRKS